MYNLAIMFDVDQVLCELRDVEASIYLMRQLTKLSHREKEKLWTYKYMQHRYRTILMADVYDRHYPIK